MFNLFYFPSLNNTITSNKKQKKTKQTNKNEQTNKTKENINKNKTKNPDGEGTTRSKLITPNIGKKTTITKQTKQAKLT